MAQENKSKVSILTNGIIKENPVLRLVLGTCSILAVTTAVSSALGMGAAFTFVLVCSNIMISLLRKVIPGKVHLPCYIVIIAGFVTIVQMFMQAYMESLYNALGVFLPLIVVNCIILGRAEMFACKNNVVDSALDGLKDYDGKQDVRAWLFTVARNAYYDHCRRAKHAAPLEDAETKAADSPDIAQLLVDKDAAFTVHQCLHALEEPYKEVFSLRVFGELPFDRIGAIFGHNAAWARVTYYRAKTRIQTMLEQRK